MQPGPRWPWTALATVALAAASAAFAACAPARGPAPVDTGDRPTPGGVVRVLLPLPAEADRLRAELSAGPFAVAGSGLVARRDAAGRGPYVDEIDVATSSGEAPLLLSLGEVDLALVFGEDVDRAAAATGVELTAVPGWDRAYSLWFARRGRWLGDARVRGAIADAVDRAALVRYSLAGRGQPTTTLVGAADEPAGGPAGPVPPGTAITLRHDPADRVAAALAARLHATLSLAGIAVDLRDSVAAAGPAPDEVLLLGRRAAGPAAAVLAELLAPLAPDPDAARGLARLAGGGDAAAPLAEYELRVAGRLVPLLRVEAWVATRRNRIAGGPTASAGLGLDAVWIRR